MTRYAIIDFETNGLMPGQGGRALEVAAVIVEEGRIVDSWQSLMNPGVHVPAFITALTGITPAMVRAAPPPAEAMAGIAGFVGDTPLVAHNASFDRRFWQHELALIDQVAAQDFLCTVLISRRLYPWAPNHKLATLVELHALPEDGNYHRALADASMTAHLFLRMQRDLAALYAGEAVDADFLRQYQTTVRAKVRGTPEVRSKRRG
ncbi:MAG: polymerase subunit epsilon [Moraxellaceae bacterium]|jgi:DNA polymerase-3 subunit epsilon|nr:polymerase subunit epsilon [Moraxellaceae bacterium]